MLLKHLYDYATSRKLLDDLAFAPKAVRWIINLDAAGKFLDVVETGDGKRGKEFSCPQTFRAKDSGTIAEFLADGIDSIFRLSANPTKPKDVKKLNAKHHDFWRQIARCVKETKSPELLAVLRFHTKVLRRGGCQFLRWGKSLKPEQAENVSVVQKKNSGKTREQKQEKEKETWWVKTANENEVKLGAENFMFRVDQELLVQDDVICAWWRKQHTEEINTIKADSPLGFCMISEQPRRPIAKTHGVKIMRVPAAQGSGASLVSFNKPAFTSYGFKDSINSPVSVDAAIAYCTALNSLLDNENTALRIGQTALCFWAKEDKTAGKVFANLLNKPDPSSVHKFLVSPWAGIERDPAKKDQFLAVTLVGNAGRVVVRHWLQETVEQAVENFKKWFKDLRIKTPQRPEPKTPKQQKTSGNKTQFNPLSIYWLANTTVRDSKDLQPEIPAQLYRAALENSAPSTAFIKPIINQIQSRLLRDENYKLIYDESRFALLKLIHNRNRKKNDMEIQPTLTADTHDAAYNCGRLLSVLSETQKKAQGYPKGFSGIAERYFGTACSSPATVLPLLLRLNRHHLDKIRKTGGNAYQEKQVRDILARFQPAGDKLPPVFPRNLDLQAQGRFALGFYQQQAADADARAEAKAAKENENENKNSADSAENGTAEE